MGSYEEEQQRCGRGGRKNKGEAGFAAECEYHVDLHDYIVTMLLHRLVLSQPQSKQNSNETEDTPSCRDGTPSLFFSLVLPHTPC